MSPEPPLCVHLHVGLTASVLLYSGSENAFHASSVASEKVKKSNRKWDVGVIADRDTGSIDVAKFGSNYLSYPTHMSDYHAFRYAAINVWNLALEFKKITGKYSF